MTPFDEFKSLMGHSGQLDVYLQRFMTYGLESWWPLAPMDEEIVARIYSLVENHNDEIKHGLVKYFSH